MASAPAHRLSTEETLCQISTFIAAGHETTASALTWTLYALAQAPRVQHRLRAELRSTAPDNLARLPYLDWVVREALRVHAPVTNTMRVCMRDVDEIPVARPFRDRAGRLHDSIRVRRWDIISVPIQAINKSIGLWGEDAQVFRLAPVL